MTSVRDLNSTLLCEDRTTVESLRSFDLDLPLLGLLELRKRQFQHAVLVGRADSGGIHGPRQGKAAREGSECAFETVGVFLFELRLPLALSTEHQRVVLDTDVDVVLLQSRKLGRDDQVISFSLLPPIDVRAAQGLVALGFSEPDPLVH